MFEYKFVIKKNRTDFYENCFLGQFQFDAKQIASEYLNRIFRKYNPQTQAIFLKKASEEYRNAKIEFEKFTLIFPYFDRE
jgi:hypothetical protein